MRHRPTIASAMPKPGRVKTAAVITERSSKITDERPAEERGWITTTRTLRPPPIAWSPFVRYGTAIAIVLVAAALRIALDPVWGAGVPYITFYPAVMLAAWLGGLGPGVVATALSALLAHYFWVLPSFTIADALSLFFFALMGVFISVLNEAWRRSTRAALDAEERLRAVALERTRLLEAERTVLAREQTARAEIERASRLKDEFLAVLSHELRTPLNAVLGYAHLLRSGSLPSERAKHAIDAIHRNAQAQARLVESLLDLSRVMAGKLELNLEPLDVSKVVDAAVDVVRPDAETKGVALDVPPTRGATVLTGDAGRLQQVFWNLLSNAIKFTPRAGHVHVSIGADNGNATIKVSDDGQGIRRDFLPFVFDRFKQADTDKGRPSAGLGLGLALVREIVHAHGGTVLAESLGEGRGSTFTVALPLSVAALTNSESVSAVDNAFESLPRFDILIVDDDGDVRDLLSLLLESRGARVLAVSSAADALEAIGTRTPDVLLADLRMPDEDGYSLIRKIRACEQETNSGHLPAIAVTADATATDRERAVAAGYDGHVGKPIDPNVLARAIVKVVRADNA
jgi:signal transduction histidine kinase/ActR/RegA family two-component response regulator